MKLSGRAFCMVVFAWANHSFAPTLPDAGGDDKVTLEAETQKVRPARSRHGANSMDYHLDLLPLDGDQGKYVVEVGALATATPKK